jgi:glycosidase
MLWQADSNYHLLSILEDASNVIAGYSPLDFSVLDPHWGSVNDWRRVIDQIHARGMYFMADFTVGTMGDLIAFDGYVHYTSQPFSLYLITSPPQTSQIKYTFQFERV